MAKFVLAGKADCPYYAKAEYLADKCQMCLPNFSVRKIPILPEQWQDWLDQKCESNSWTHAHSPLIWRDVGLGCRGLLLGGLTDFMEHCQTYYNITVEIPSPLMEKISQENMAAFLDQHREEQEQLSSIKPLHVWICSALSPVAPFLISELLLDPEVYPKSSVISLHLLHLHLDLNEENKQGLNSDQILDQLTTLQMETQDLAAPRLHQVSIHTSLHEAFTDADQILLLDDDLPQTPEEQSSLEDLEHYRQYGLRIQSSSRSEVRVVLFSLRSVNQKCAALLQHCPSVNRKNFVTVATHLENHIRVRIANKLQVRAQDVRGVLVWGDVCSSYFVDTQRAQIHHCDRGITPPGDVGLPIPHLQELRNWCETELQVPVTDHFGALCSAYSVLCVLRAWDRPGTVLSAGVHCAGFLDLPDGLVLSVPVQFSDGSWTLLSDLNIHRRIRETLLQCSKELPQV
ncbi:putative malate dehydrogenase 1B [Eucyclogobius newberryi]|uniref:putative malate dehydrogenase 1B n=1 Tax=Eucyclogobius newberryi TaxID=166745 RepID=UPI003B5A2C44